MKPLLARLSTWRRLTVILLLLRPALGSMAAISDGVIYTNFTRPGPIEIHVLKIARNKPHLEIQSIHSGAKPIGRSPLTEQLKMIKGGNPIAAINGDFFQLEGAFAGDPRGLQIVNGALISAPANTATFWIDSSGAPHIGLSRSALRITWPNGSTAPIGLNGQCDASELELYTPDLDSSPRGDNTGREIVLVPRGTNTTSAALRPGKEYSFKALQIREAKDGPISPGSFLLTLGPTAAAKAPSIQPGAVVNISTATTPSFRGVSNAISGGPVLITAGKRHRYDKAASSAFQHRFMVEKHPRTALGWSKNEYFWVEVDGRHKDSVGMTLNELGELMLELGCTEAMNLDGGGSSTLWFDGKVRNRPSDGAERPIANALVLVRK